MNTQIRTQEQSKRRTIRTRSNIKGTSIRPRLSVIISNTNVYAQLIDDEVGNTVLESNSAKSSAKTLTDKAVFVGKEIAERAKKVKISEVVFDRGSKKFHGRIKAVAESAREAGLKV